MKFKDIFSDDAVNVLGRVLDAYGFHQKIQLSQHLGISNSSLSMRYQRDVFPYDIVLRCALETGKSLSWLALGQGDDKGESSKISNSRNTSENSHLVNLPRKHLSLGKIVEEDELIFDKNFFLNESSADEALTVFVESGSQYLINSVFQEIHDGKWLIEIEGSTSIRTITRIPIGKVRVQGNDSDFECKIDDINPLGKVVLTCS